MPHVVLIRHGETEWTISGRHTGRTDIALTAAGRVAARNLGGMLGGWRFSTVLTSPLSRAIETCELSGYGDVAVLDTDLREWDYGDDEGRTTKDIRRELPGWTVWEPGPRNGESLADVGARADRVLARIDSTPGDVALFGHGHLIRVLAARWLGQPPIVGRLLALDPSSVSVLGYEREQRVIHSWNATDQPDPLSSSG